MRKSFLHCKQNGSAFPERSAEPFCSAIDAVGYQSMFCDFDFLVESSDGIDARFDVGEVDLYEAVVAGGGFCGYLTVFGINYDKISVFKVGNVD